MGTTQSAKNVQTAEEALAQAEEDLAAAEAAAAEPTTDTTWQKSTEQLLAEAPPLVLPEGTSLVVTCKNCGLKLADPPKGTVCPNCGKPL